MGDFVHDFYHLGQEEVPREGLAGTALLAGGRD